MHVWVLNCVCVCVCLVVRLACMYIIYGVRCTCTFHSRRVQKEAFDEKMKMKKKKTVEKTNEFFFLQYLFLVEKNKWNKLPYFSHLKFSFLFVCLLYRKAQYSIPRKMWAILTKILHLNANKFRYKHHAHSHTQFVYVWNANPSVEICIPFFSLIGWSWKEYKRMPICT